MSAENIDQRDGQTVSLPPLTDEQDRRMEIWPDFGCKACGNDESLVVWEETSYQNEEQARGEQYYEGRKPCCRKCGSRVVPDRVDHYRPEEWKQPIYRVISGIAGMGYSHPAVVNICNVYEGDPEAFLTASVSDLKTIDGIGETFADRIHTRRATLYPSITPEVEGSLYAFRGRRIREIDPQRIARDLTIGLVEADDLVTVEEEAEQAVLRETADILRENKDREFWKGGRTPEEMVDLADQVSQQIND